MRITPSLFRGAALAGAVLLSVVGFAHVQLKNPGNGSPLHWGDPTNVGVVISSIGSPDISDSSTDIALRLAIEAWNDSSGTTAQLIEDTSAESRARTDWSSSSIHMFWFDEENDTGYFPGGSSTVAITPIWFYSSGRIDDADVLFNGKNFRFTTSGQSGRFDVQDVATHELGHLLGLDHSGSAGATMYPYVDSTIILHRSLSEDDVTGLRDMYPEGSFAAISGTVKRASDESPVAGAHIVVRDAEGRTASGVLSSADGSFELGGLEAGSYEVYATPLDAPVSAANIGSTWTVETDFESTVHGTVAVTAGESVSIGDFLVGDDVSVSLGRSSDRFPHRCTSGSSIARILRGSGLVEGSTLSASDPDLVVTLIAWLDSQVAFSIEVPGDEAPGHSDLIVTDPSGQESILVAGLEITPPDPGVTLVSPNQADIGGGTAVTILGSEFGAGARVVFGGEVYEDGEAGGCTVVNSTTITLTTHPSAPGISDVVVIDSSGVEGRKTNAFQFLAVPAITTVFPSAGAAWGGTELILTGENFVSGVVVRIGGVVQSEVTLASSAKMVITTEGGAVGGPYLLEVENPGGLAASSQFSYASPADPRVIAVAPETGSAAGGETVTITGTDFPDSVRVVFGSDPDTGEGGAAATSIVVVNSTTLEVTTPSSSSGLVSILIEAIDSGQAGVIEDGFTFAAAGGGGGGGGGGGCSAAPIPGPPGGGRILGLLAWLGVVMLGLRVGRRRSPMPARVRAG
jgi:hypothetical protein